MFLCIQQIHIVILRVQVGFLVRKHLQVLKRHRKLMSEKLHGKSLIQHICIKLLHQEVKCSIYQEELNTFLKQMPEGMLKAEEERQQINAILQEIRHEKRIVNRIVEEERSLNKEQKISKTERTEIRHRR